MCQAQGWGLGETTRNETEEGPTTPDFPLLSPAGPGLCCCSHWPPRSLAIICTCCPWTVCELSSSAILGPQSPARLLLAWQAVGCIVSHQALLPTPRAGIYRTM